MLMIKLAYWAEFSAQPYSVATSVPTYGEPNIYATYDSSTYWLADGFHRITAAILACLSEIPANIINGTKRDAILYSVGANANHGLRRTNADKRKAVLMLLQDDEWKLWSSNRIAKQCAVSHTFVDNFRDELSCNGCKIEPQQQRKVERNGTTYVQDTSNIGKPQKPKALPSGETIVDAEVIFEEIKEYNKDHPFEFSDDDIVMKGEYFDSDIKATFISWTSVGKYR